MTCWEAEGGSNGQPRFVRDYSETWGSATKIVFSTTLDTVSGANATIELDFDPDAMRRMKDAVDRDISVGGPHLAAQAIKAGLVDEFHLFVVSIVVGGGTPPLPDDLHQRFELTDVDRFANGMVHLQYCVAP